MSGEQYSGRLHVLDSPTVWSECMWDRKKRRAPAALRKLQKSTAMGVPGSTVPLMAGRDPAPLTPVLAGSAAHAREARGGAGPRARGGAASRARGHVGGAVGPAGGAGRDRDWDRDLE